MNRNLINLQKTPSNDKVTIPNIQNPPQSKEPKAYKEKTTKKRPLIKKNDDNYAWRNQSKDRNLISVILKEYPQTALYNPEITSLIEKLIKKR